MCRLGTDWVGWGKSGLTVETKPGPLVFGRLSFPPPWALNKKTHDWMVDQITDLFHTTHKVKTQQVVKSRGQHCGDVEMVGYPTNTTGPVSLVMDLRITHDRVGSSTDPTLNGQIRYPNNLDQSLNDTTVDKVRKYQTDYNMNPPNTVSFMPTIASTSGRLHNELVRLLFWQTHRETDHFFADSGASG